MKRRAFLASLTMVGLAFAVPALAQTAQEQIIRQLQRQGYRNIRVSRTWLGRVRIVARGRRGTREIVLNPSSGVILRDYLDRGGDGGSGGGGFDRGGSGGSGGNSGAGGGDDDDDDNSGPGGGDDDDDDDDDKSGSGSGNSGSGSSGSGGNSGSGGGGGDDDD